MPGPESVSLSGNNDIDALLTGYKWDATSLTFSFPENGIWYVEEQFFDLASAEQLAVFAATALILGPVAAITEHAVSVAVVGVVALNGFQEFIDARKISVRVALDQFASVSSLSFRRQYSFPLITFEGE